MRAGRFWVSSSAAAGGISVAWALAVPLVSRLRPRAGLEVAGGIDLWLLGVFTTGVLACLLGLSAVAGGPLPGRRAKAALARWLDRAEPVEDERSSPVSGWWVVAVGMELLVLYGVGWLTSS